MAIDITYTYAFQCILTGDGTTPEDAWDNAREGFWDEPGVPPDPEIFEGQVEFQCDCGWYSYHIFPSISWHGTVEEGVEAILSTITHCPNCGSVLAENESEEWKIPK